MNCPICGEPMVYEGFGDTDGVYDDELVEFGLGDFVEFWRCDRCKQRVSGELVADRERRRVVCAITITISGE